MPGNAPKETLGLYERRYGSGEPPKFNGAEALIATAKGGKLADLLAQCELLGSYQAAQALMVLASQNARFEEEVANLQREENVKDQYLTAAAKD